ncbi:TonB-dependent receptor [Erythrobacter sp. NFXS35]|uniref:TonB-dependent receptor n=1 Tax=Erythrobacter sp. NFXS35 TaxID=2818436 RepID=UPI0032DE4874
MRAQRFERSLAWLLLAGVSTPVLAQNPEPTTVEAEDAEGEIVVTAQRRDQSLATVAAAVTVLSSEALDLAAIRDTQDLVRLAPSLVITTASSEQTNAVIRLRGVGTSGGNLGLEGSVGVFVDGIYRSRSGIALSELFDVERIEVLRGPQGTLFGKNTTAGAILLTTRAPTFEFGGYADVVVQNRDGLRVTGALNAPVVDDLLAVRLSGAYNKRDGFIDDIGLDRDMNNRDRFSLRGQALFTPTINSTFRIIADYAEKNEDCCAAPYVAVGARAPVIASLGGFVPSDLNSFAAASSILPRARSKEWGLTFDGNVDLGFAEWHTLLSWRDFQASRSGDLDFNSLDIARIAFEDTRDKFFTAEMTLSGQTGPVDWLVGAFAFDQQTRQQSANVYGSDMEAFLVRSFPGQAGNLAGNFPAGTGAVDRRLSQSSRGFSFFTHNIIEVLPSLKLTLGLRWLQEEKDGSGQFLSNGPICDRPGVPAGLRLLCATPDYDATFADEALVGTAGVAYELSSRSVVHVTWSRGYKAGGINLDPSAGLGSAAGLLFEPEQVDNIEIGARYRTVNGKAAFAVNLFQADFTDFQQNAFDGQQSIISNAAEVRSRGIEIEANLKPDRAVSVDTSLTWNPTEYGNATSPANLVGRQIVNAPEWMWQAQARVDQPLFGRVSGFASANIRLQSDINTAVNLAPQAEQDGYFLLGGRVGLRDTAGRWEVSAFTQNLGDVYYRQIVFASVLQPGSFNAFLGEPQTYGIETRWRF